MSENNNKVFEFDKNSEDHDEEEIKDVFQDIPIKKEKKNEDAKSLDDGDSNYVKKLDLYERANIKKLTVNHRNQRKIRTEKIAKSKFNIEKFSEDITKITEYINPPGPLPSSTLSLSRKDNSPEKNEVRLESKKKTIRFADKRITFQYPKGKEMVGVYENKEETEKEREKEIFDEKEKVLKVAEVNKEIEILVKKYINQIKNI